MRNFFHESLKQVSKFHELDCNEILQTKIFVFSETFLRIKRNLLLKQLMSIFFSFLDADTHLGNPLYQYVHLFVRQ